MSESVARAAANGAAERGLHGESWAITPPLGSLVRPAEFPKTCRFVKFSPRSAKPASLSEFARTLKIPSGKRAGDPLEPLAWWERIFEDVASGEHSELLASAARGNAKSGLCGVIGLAALVGIPPFAGHRVITLTSATLQTAGLLFEEMQRMAAGTEWAAGIRSVRGIMHMFWEPDGSRFEVLSTPRAMIGRGPALAILDEVSVIKNAEQVLATARSGLAKVDGMLLVAGTRSRDDASGELMESLIEDWERGEMGGAVYSAPDPTCDLDDLEAIKAANPALGVTITADAILKKARRARSPAAISIYRQHALNQPVVTADSSAWLPADFVDSLRGDAPAEGPCVGAIAVAPADNPTVCVRYWPQTQRLEARAFSDHDTAADYSARLPVKALNEQRDWWCSPDPNEALVDAAKWLLDANPSQLLTQSWQLESLRRVAPAAPWEGLDAPAQSRSLEIADRALRSRQAVLVGNGGIAALGLTGCRISRSPDGRRVIRTAHVPLWFAAAIALALGTVGEPEPEPPRPMRVGWIDLETGAIQ